MKQLALRNGDLAIEPDGLAMVRGVDKLRQDLGAMVREALGTDRFHPRFGTVLQEYVGRPPNAETSMLIRGEIQRCVQNYMMIQDEAITRDMADGRQPRFAPEEIVISIGSIQIQQRFDRLNVKVSVATLAGGDVTVLRSLGV